MYSLQKLTTKSEITITILYDCYVRADIDSQSTLLFGPFESVIDKRDFSENVPESKQLCDTLPHVTNYECGRDLLLSVLDLLPAGKVTHHYTYR